MAQSKNYQDREYFKREKDKVVLSRRSAEEYRAKYGNESIDWSFLTNYQYDNKPGGDQRR